MKIKNTFISNSSTTSFLIYGAEIKDGDEEKAYGLGLNVYYGDPMCGYIYAGLSWDSIGDNETGLEFKQKVEGLIKQIDSNYKCSTISEAYYDG